MQERSEEVMSEMKLSDRVVEWTRDWFRRNGRETAVIGISGGKDSAVVAGICAKALGPDHVVGVMMPNGVQADLDDSKKVIESLGIRGMEVNIAGMCEAGLSGMNKAIKLACEIGMLDPELVKCVTKAAYINMQPRVRMTVLYTIAQSLSGPGGMKACVVGTGNKAESMVGYTTKGGDAMCDVDPIGDMWVDEVVRVGDELGVCPEVVHKIPSDGLCGLSDEDRLGFTYGQVKQVFTGAVGEVDRETADRIMGMFSASAHKRRMPDVFLVKEHVRREGA